ncbi:MAG: S9 family peptidase [Oscillospiraceae bacterium]|nr:S9 family peptidase [Oscillospiraceae bacterium]
MKELKLQDFYEYKFLSGLNFSPDKKQAAFVVHNANVAANDYDSFLYLKNENGIHKITGFGKEKSYVWEDNTHLLFAAMRTDAEKAALAGGDMSTSFYRLCTCGGEAQKAFTLPFIALGIYPLEDGKYAVKGQIDANVPDYYKMDAAKRAEVAKNYKENADYEVFDEAPFWFNGVGFINKKRTALFVYDSKTGETQRVTAPTFSVSDVAVDGSVVYYFGEDFDTKMSMRQDIFMLDTKTRKKAVVYSGREYSISSMKMMGSDLLLVASTQERYGFCENPYFYTMDPAEGQFKILCALEDGVGNTVGSDCRFGATTTVRAVNGEVYFLTTRRNAGHLYKLDSEGKQIPVLTLEGSADDFDVAADGSILLIGMYDNRLQELYSYCPNSDKLQKLSSFNDEILKDKYVADYNKMSIVSADTAIDGWVLLPKDYDPTKKYPAIMDMHGGPKTVFGEVFYHEMQCWANMGYFVYFINPIGSDGRGNEFADLRGKYGTVDYDNFMDFTDAVLEKYPQIDRSRVAVTGGSYGGFMTNWIIGHTDRFCAAATQRSISNWISFYGISDIGIPFGNDQMAADIFTNVEKMWWHSPLKYAKNIKTPTLFIHSDADYRCPIAEAMQLYTALVDLGVPTRMCLFKGENHELSRGGKPKHRLRRLNEITDWIVKYTK